MVQKYILYQLQETGHKDIQMNFSSTQPSN